MEAVEPGTWKPTEKFIAWVRRYGINTLSKDTGATRDAIYAWIKGKRGPRMDYVRKLIQKSHERPVGVGPLTPDDIVGPVN